MRGPLSEFRRNIIVRIFKAIDVSQQGFINITDLKSKYRAAQHPDVKAGKRTEKEERQDFESTFD